MLGGTSPGSSSASRASLSRIASSRSPIDAATLSSIPSANQWWIRTSSAPEMDDTVSYSRVHSSWTTAWTAGSPQAA